MFANQPGPVADVYHVECPIAVADVTNIVAYGCSAFTKFIVCSPAAAIRNNAAGRVYYSRWCHLRLSRQFAGFHVVHYDPGVYFSSEVLSVQCKYPLCWQNVTLRNTLQTRQVNRVQFIFQNEVELSTKVLKRHILICWDVNTQFHLLSLLRL